MVTKQDIMSFLAGCGIKRDDKVTIHCSLRSIGKIENGADGLLVGDGWNVKLLQNGVLRFPAEAKGWLSLFTSGDKAEGVTLRGLKYELTGAELTCTFPLGVSNEFLGRSATISVEKGSLFVLWQGELLPEVIT